MRIAGVVRALAASALLVLAVRFAATRSESAARRLFFGSIIYLPIIWIVMIANNSTSYGPVLERAANNRGGSSRPTWIIPASSPRG